MKWLPLCALIAVVLLTLIATALFSCAWIGEQRRYQLEDRPTDEVGDDGQ